MMYKNKLTFTTLSYLKRTTISIRSKFVVSMMIFTPKL